jgi:DNA-binding GntR family transcriptional regulator
MSVVRDSLLYSRVETVLASEIIDEDLRVGDQLPTEDSLISRFEIASHTSKPRKQRALPTVPQTNC